MALCISITFHFQKSFGGCFHR
ncbi:hypothetical protein DSM3645_03118 [Blastopirellula marina DSM 3645]|uniref:Uncharacterized protein n=1 Tax=Blastopirellula marina DSM 3645 TaxID=314230 RepID=A3ZVT7_9BACT|nr:hypothetical protein DSM3645_03118 [Blastopirellula marina DSM 3645]